MKGGSDTIYNLKCSHVLIDGEEVEMTPQHLKEIDEVNMTMAKHG